jgi:hypothetical protein
MAYLSQLVNTSTFVRDKINMLIAPCGSGKTKFAINHITSGKYKLGRILYVIDVNNNKDHFMSSYPHIFTAYDQSWMGELYKSKESWVNFTNSPLFSRLDGENAKVTIINYAQLGALLTHYPAFYSILDLVILDEPHHFYKYNARYLTKPLSHAQITHTAILNMATDKTTQVVAITATPSKFLKYITPDRICHINYDKSKLTRYLTATPTKHTTPNSALKEILGKYPSPHILVYTPYIRSMLKLQQLFKQNNLHAVCLWSRNNTAHPYTQVQNEVYDHLVEYKTLPSDVDVLILNAAFETGMDINDKRFDIFWGQSGEIDSLIQSRGRIRGDIKASVVVTKAFNWEKMDSLDWGKEEWRVDDFVRGLNSGEGEHVGSGNLVPKEYLDVFLNKQDKEKLASKLNIIGSQGRQLKWTGVKQILLNNGYEVKSKVKKIDGRQIRGDVICRVKISFRR